MSDKTKVAASETASQNSGSSSVKGKKTASSKKSVTDAKGGEKKSRKKYKNPFNYSDSLQSKFVNCIMKDGKKSIAEQILKDTFDELNKKGEKDPLKTFELADANVKPTMEVKAKRIGGAVYQIPLEVGPKRQQSLSIRWILEGARKRKGMPMHRRLALELIDAANKTGYSFTKKEETHRMAQANKAFAHFARY